MPLCFSRLASASCNRRTIFRQKAISLPRDISYSSVCIAQPPVRWRLRPEPEAEITSAPPGIIPFSRPILKWSPANDPPGIKIISGRYLWNSFLPLEHAAKKRYVPGCPRGEGPPKPFLERGGSGRRTNSVKRIRRGPLFYLLRLLLLIGGCSGKRNPNPKEEEHV